MQPITVEQLRGYLKDYDDNKGPYRSNWGTSWLVGDQSDIARLRKFNDGLINPEGNRELCSVELFQLARIVLKSHTSQGAESDKIFDKLKEAFGKEVLIGLGVLNEYNSEYKLCTEENFQKIAAARDPVQAAKIIAALHILHDGELRCAKIAELRPQVEAHAAPDRLAKAVNTVSMEGFKFTTEENLQKVLSSGDPLRTAEEIVYPEVAPGFDPTNPGYLPRLNFAYHMSWTTLFKSMNARRGSDHHKDHCVDACEDLRVPQLG